MNFRDPETRQKMARKGWAFTFMPDYDYYSKSTKAISIDIFDQNAKGITMLVIGTYYSEIEVPMVSFDAALRAANALLAGGVK